MSQKKKPIIIIEGITLEGKKFRPSDWADRLSGNLSTFKNHRIYYSPLLRPSYRDGNRCVVMDPELETLNPALFQQILDFAKENKLTIIYETEDHYEAK